MFPVLFENGNAQGAVASHSHLPPNADNPSAVTSREIVFLQLADGDGDGRPDIDANGRAIWDSAEISYVLVPQANGSNNLERRIDGILDRVVLRNVDSVFFDDRSTSGFTVPFRSIRVTLSASRRDSDGRQFTETVIGSTLLRNSPPL